MFNSETYVKNVTTNKVQQVSGSLIKTDPNSVFIRFDKGSPREYTIFDPEPTIKINGHSYKITVLQVMLSHDNSYICEVIIDGSSRQDF